MEAVAVAIIIAQLTELRLAIGRHGRRVDKLEADCGAARRSGSCCYLHAGIGLAAGLLYYSATH